MNTSIEALLGILSDMAIMLEMQDENQFKVRAMQAAVRSLDDANFEYLDLDAISTIPGIGKGTLALVREYAETGAIKEHQDLQAVVPPTVLEMTHLRGLGAKKVRTLWKELNITSIAELQTAVKEHRIVSAKGFGAKTEANIAEAIAQYLAAKGQFHLHKAWLESERICNLLETVPGIKALTIGGEAAQGAETVRSLVIVGACEDGAPIHSLLCEAPLHAGCTELEEIDGSENDNITLQGTSANGFATTIILANQHEYTLAAHKVTSSREYHTEILKRLEERIPSHTWETMEQIYSTLQLPTIPPELRITPVILNKPNVADIVRNLATDKQMRGMLHVHSTWSDGKHTIRQMAEHAQKMGYEYIAICDHSKTAVYAGGLTEERVKQQHEEIDRLNDELQRLSPNAIRVLKGIESDILRDGSLDYSDTVLETFDVVVASVHSSFSLDKNTMTDRVCKALEHPATTLLGHPTGRLLLMRKGYELDMEVVLDTAKANNKAIEINANPYRLDLSAEHAALAEAWGVHIAINTDAHNMDDLGYMRYGLQISRRAGLQASSVVNALSLQEFCQRFGVSMA